MFSVKDKKYCKHTVYSLFATYFTEASSFTAWKQLIRFSPTMACAASVPEDNLPWPPSSSMKDCRSFSHNSGFCLEPLPCQHNWATQLSPRTAEMFLRCLVGATYWASVTSEPSMTSLVGSRFTCLHLNECCMTWCLCIQRLPKGLWLFFVTLSGSCLSRIGLISLKRTRY